MMIGSKLVVVEILIHVRLRNDSVEQVEEEYVG
jgi:hypothetical protein